MVRFTESLTSISIFCLLPWLIVVHDADCTILFDKFGTFSSGPSLCSDIKCDQSFLNSIRAIMVLSCNQCFALNYSFCTSFKGSQNMTSLFFCDHNFPKKCRLEEKEEERKPATNFSYICYKSHTLSDPPDVEVVEVNDRNFSIRVPNIRLQDYWNRVELISFKVRLFCPEAVCSQNFDKFVNDTFLIREIDLTSNPELSYYIVTVPWDSLEAIPETIGEYRQLAVSLDYSFSYNETFLADNFDFDYYGNFSEHPDNLTRKTKYIGWRVQNLHSKPSLVQFSIAAETRMFSAGLLVLLILVVVLLSGMLLACLARRHASSSLSSRHKKRTLDETMLAPMRSTEKFGSNFEEGYKLLPMPSKIGPENIGSIEASKGITIENNNADYRNLNVSTTSSSLVSQKGNFKNGPNYKVYTDICQSNSIVVPYSDLDLLEIIGQGRFGLIKRGYVGQKTECMVHCAKAPYAISPEESKVFLEHLDSSIKARSHPNVISFIGVCGQGEDLYIAMQLENGQNLRNLLRESRSMENFMHFGKAHGKISLMSSQRLLSVMLGIARGMNYLEDNNVLHENLAAVSIIIGENGTPKIGNFGMAQLCDLYKRQNDRDHRTLRWMPPETLQDHLFSLKSQIWSFGVVLWEIATLGGMPYNELSDQEVLDQVLGGYRLRRPFNISQVFYTLMNAMCWNKDPDCRPNFQEIIRHLHDLNLNPEEHINLNRTENFKYEQTWLLRA